MKDATSSPKLPLSSRALFGVLIALALVLPVRLQASELTASDADVNDRFGQSVSQSGSTALVGAWGNDDGGSGAGSAYVFRSLLSGPVTEDAKLVASDAAAFDNLGASVSLDGSTALIGAVGGDDSTDGGRSAGSAYVFRGLDTATGTVTEDVKLLASDAAAFDNFGESVSLDGSTALVGAWLDGGLFEFGSAYVFRGLDTATGTVTEDVKLLASDPVASHHFGISVSLDGGMAVVGAIGDNEKGRGAGAAYVFRGLGSAVGVVTEDVKLVVSDGAAGDSFGQSVSLDGSNALVGGRNSGSAYVFRDLDSAEGTVTEDVRLVASDGATGDSFGESVSLSGSTALVGALGDDDSGSSSGSAYVFRNLFRGPDTLNEDVKLVASDAATGDLFGQSVSLDGFRFVIGAPQNDDGGSNSGKAYAGDLRAFTTLDAGSIALATRGLSFVSRDDWVIGLSTDGNAIILSDGDSATVMAAGKSVFIGRNAEADHNVLSILGELTAESVYIGAAGNTGNRLVVRSGGRFDISVIELAFGNELELAGDLRNSVDFFAFLGDTELWVNLVPDRVQVADSVGFSTLFSSVIYDAANGRTRFVAASVIPEPSNFAALAGLVGLAFLVLTRRTS